MFVGRNQVLLNSILSESSNGQSLVLLLIHFRQIKLLMIVILGVAQSLMSLSTKLTQGETRFAILMWNPLRENQREKTID